MCRARAATTALLAIVGLTIGSGPASAHHPVELGRVDPGARVGGAATTGGGAGLLSVGFAYSYRRYAGALVGAASLDDGVARDADVTVLRLDLAAHLPTATTLALALPWADVDARGDVGRASTAGLADLALTARQDLGVLYDAAPAWVPRVALGLALTLPTGDAGEETTARVSRLTRQGYGVGLTSYEVRASRGAGVALASADCTLGWGTAAPVGAEISGSLRAPLATTASGTRWGADMALSGRVIGRLEVAPDAPPAEVWLRASWAVHEADTRRVVVPGDATGKAREIATGARSQVRLEIGASLPIAAGFGAWAAVGVPVEERADGLQLRAVADVGLGVGWRGL